MKRDDLQGTRARIAIAAAAAATLAGATWGAVALTGTAGGTEAPQQNLTRPKDDGSGGGDGKGGPQPGGSGPSGPQVPDSIAHASEAGGDAVNITIDDGPDPAWTPKVLDVLARYDVKATFCMIGPQARAHPDLVKKVVAAGHRLCDHSVSHDTRMDKKPVDYQEQQILEAKKMIEDVAGGAKVEYYRAPGGAFTPDSRRIAAAHGMRPLGWNVDSKDFKATGPGAIVDTVKGQISNGPTILLHDGGGDRRHTVEALDRLLAWLKAEGRPTGFPVRTAP
ncbi:polysaccharide deacetylase family protein [Streptomyces sp. NPDC090022]|uniref:polysaccharide deacetylase family protein n=1 Tax=Streptomyces sp. NPDC090022 TaxID=3365920 RepID=UPI00381EFD45